MSSNNAETKVSSSEYSWSGNLGLDYPLNSQWDATFNLGRGIRPATLSERFFTGQTGRGSVVGNPNLKTESNFEIDGGIRFHQSDAFAGVYVFRNRIEDFIDRVSTTGDAFTFVNQPAVTIQGFELEGVYSYAPFRFFSNFHKILGSNQSDADVNDIPPTRLLAGIEYENSQWSGSLEFIRQFRKSDPGSVEFALDPAFLIDLKAGYKFSPNIEVSFSGSNLTDETYFASADNRAPLSIGRSFSLEFALSN
jgi:iron complex outermembrane receptor protein